MDRVVPSVVEEAPIQTGFLDEHIPVSEVEDFSLDPVEEGQKFRFRFLSSMSIGIGVILLLSAPFLVDTDQGWVLGCSALGLILLSLYLAVKGV
jgi:hypothetical protein